MMRCIYCRFLQLARNENNHIPQIVGEVTTDQIPCDLCWTKNNKPFDPEETQLILLPGHVDEDDEDTEPLELLLPALYRKSDEDKEDTEPLELLLPALYRKCN